jgi:hypothetical protein
MPRKICGEKQILWADYRQITEAPKEMGKYFSLCEEKLFLGRREIYYHLECRGQDSPLTVDRCPSTNHALTVNGKLLPLVGAPSRCDPRKTESARLNIVRRVVNG